MATWPLIATGKIEGGRLRIKHRQRFLQNISTRKNCDVELVIHHKCATRSLAQNAYWWGVCVALVSEHTGYTPDEIHEIAKQKFLPKKLAIQDGNGEIKGEFVIGGTTTRLNKIEFGEFIEMFRRWAAMDLDVVIPDADAYRD